MSRIVNAGVLQGIACLKDGSLKFTICTQEANPDLAGALVRYNNQFVKFLLTDGNIHEQEAELVEELPQAKPKEPGKKSPGQRLRAVLYLLWKQNSRGFEDAEAHYEHMMDAIIEHYRNKLD